VIEPVHPLQRRKFERFFGLPRGPTVNHFSLVKTIDGFRHGIVITISAASNRGKNSQKRYLDTGTCAPRGKSR